MSRENTPVSLKKLSNTLTTKTKVKVYEDGELLFDDYAYKLQTELYYSLTKEVVSVRALKENVIVIKL